MLKIGEVCLLTYSIETDVTPAEHVSTRYTHHKAWFGYIH